MPIRHTRRSKRPQRLVLSAKVLWPLLILLGIGVAYTLYLDHIIRVKFEGKRWALPAYVYAQPLELYAGARLSAAQFERELRMLDYRPLAGAASQGSYDRHGDDLRVTTRPFQFWDNREESVTVDARFDGDTLVALTGVDGAAMPLLRMEPVVIGRIYPAHHQDRILVKLPDVPPLLRSGLMAVEDRHFYTHWGLDPRAIARALWTDLRHGAIVQGGSTLTQQLVKNFFLNNERTLWRKLNEAVMSLLLEVHYTKDDILQTYMNEIYLGQDRDRAIHGFGLASQFYFGVPLEKLAPQQIALLIGLVKGPSYYDPRHHPRRALTRRNLVLDIMVKQHLLSSDEASQAKRQPLGVTAQPQSIAYHPAFLDLVKRQLSRDYRQEDLRSEGLRIFTTMDPLVQSAAEQVFARRLAALERQRGIKPGTLEGAMVVTTVSGGEVLAVIGGREPRYAGFDRALDAERQVGSIIKPAVYLAALSQPKKYTLATIINDEPQDITSDSGQVWQPANYDRLTHGPVPLHTALAHSYNLATVSLGMALGVPKVLDTLHALGVERDINPYPAMLLGSMSLTPLEVAQMYQTIAGGGFRTPLRTIRDVVSAQGKPLKRYPLQVVQAADPRAVYLLTTAMQEVVASGTGRSLTRYLPADLHLAGKTGTTDDLRDSWFAGFGGDRLGVVWVGRDDNESAGFTGAGGAMQVWGDVFATIGTQPLNIDPPPGIDWAWVDPKSGMRALADCRGAEKLPFDRGSEPTASAPCAKGLGGVLRRSLDWLKGRSQ
jgi:penicillin-binding protein 1B